MCHRINSQTSAMNTKTCTKCRTVYAATEEFFYTTAVTKKSTGKKYRCLRGECKTCSVKSSIAAKHCLPAANEKLRQALDGNERAEFWMFKRFGYLAKDLRRHIELQFSDGMDWGKFFAGEIHIDHITPLKDYDKASEDEMKACYALPNLRPLWASDNLAKSGRKTSLL